MVAVGPLIVCPSVVREFWRHQAVGSVSRRCFSAWLQLDVEPTMNITCLVLARAVMVVGKIPRSVDVHQLALGKLASSSAR